jgi:membrane protein
MARIREWPDCAYLAIDRRLGGWLTLLVHTGLAFRQDDGGAMARSIAYFALFSLFPLLLILLSFSSAVLVAEEAGQTVLNWVEQYMPAALSLVQENIEDILVAQTTSRRDPVGVGSILALVALLWSASGVFAAIYRSVNRAWGNPKSKLFWSDRLYGMAVVLLVGFLLLVTTLASTLVGLVRSWSQGHPAVSLLGWQPLADPGAMRLWDWLLTLLLPLVTPLAFILLYRTIPRKRIGWRDVWLGGLGAGLMWEVMRRLYTWYLANLAGYTWTSSVGLAFGSVGAIIGFLLWAYLSALIMLLGAEFTAQYSGWRRAGHPVELRAPSQWMSGWSR